MERASDDSVRRTVTIWMEEDRSSATLEIQETAPPTESNSGAVDPPSVDAAAVSRGETGVAGDEAGASGDKAAVASGDDAAKAGGDVSKPADDAAKAAGDPVEAIDDAAKAAGDPVEAGSEPDGWEKAKENLAIVYGRPEELADGKLRYSGVFAERLPADLLDDGLKNFPVYSHAQSPLGTSIHYIERMPGEINMVEKARAAERSIDLLVNACFGYAVTHTELRDDPEKLRRLKEFLTGELRDDLLNVALMMWFETGIAQTDSNSDGEALTARFLAYLIERGYTTSAAGVEAQQANMLQGALRKVATAMGYDPKEPLPEMLARLDSEEKLEEAFTAGLTTMGKTPEDLEKSMDPLTGGIFTSGASGQVIWKGVAIEPRVTNGTWDEEAKELRWDARSVSGATWSQILYARWGEPNEAYQREHFGRVALGKELVDYNEWYAGLDGNERGQWDAFLATLSPGPELIDKLNQFRFAVGKKPVETDGSVTDSGPVIGAHLIVSGLSEEQN